MSPKEVWRVMSILLLIVALLLFVGLVVVHEFGHFIAARKSGVVVEEFGIGFPPRAWSKKLKSGLLLSLNWLPLGGFVKLKGEHDADTTKGSYGAAPLGSKVLIMLAGVAMNLMAAFILLTALALIGMPKIIENQFTVQSDTRVIKSDVLVGYVEPGSPADKAGLQQRDKIKAISNDTESITVRSSEELPTITENFAGQTVTLSIVRDGIELQKKASLRSAQQVEESKKTDEPKGYIGLAPTEYTLRRSTWSAPIVAAGLIKQLTIATFNGLGSAIGGLLTGNTAQASSQVSGPVGIFVLLKDGSLLGVEFVLMIIAIISLTLAIMNFLPIPALDGGRLFVTLLYRILRRDLTQKAEDRIHGTGFAVLMLLFVLITIVDVRRFW